MKPQGPLGLGVVLCLGLFFASSASAQLPWRLFGAKTPDKNAPAKTALPDPNRFVEISVEIAWLADPVTFPYYLEAHVNHAQQLEVRGYVPSKQVREIALRTAQIYSSLTVFDSMKEHPSLLVRPSQMTSQQLQSSVLSSLKVALPKQHQQLKVDCGNDGKVYVFGPVGSIEEKIVVSHSLRRLHGCTSVQNMTTIPSLELAQNAARPTLAPAAPPANPDTKAKSWMPWSVAKGTTKQEPPLADPPKNLASETKRPAYVDVSNKANPGDGSILIPPTVAVKEKGPDLGAKEGSGVINVELPMSPIKTGISPGELQKLILLACPKATKVGVNFTSSTEVSIVIDAHSNDDISPIADRIFSLPELQNFRPNLQFNIATP